jgi:hypothetical protein
MILGTKSASVLSALDDEGDDDVEAVQASAAGDTVARVAAAGRLLSASGCALLRSLFATDVSSSTNRKNGGGGGTQKWMDSALHHLRAAEHIHWVHCIVPSDILGGGGADDDDTSMMVSFPCCWK